VNTSDFQPNWISPPGDTISDILKEKHIAVSELDKNLKCSADYVSGLLNGHAEITKDTAKKLESALGGSAEFWMKREQIYRQELPRIRKLEEANWLKELPINDMIKHGWIKEATDKIAACLQYFDVPDIHTWRKKYNSVIGMTAFRKSNSFTSEFGSIAAWLRQGEIRGAAIECEPWDENKFEKTLKNIRPLTRKKDPKEFLPELIKSCAECGVAIAIVRTPAGCRASGATMFVSPGRATLLLSFRYLSDDQFWFTFFHEAGHLMLHGNKSIFLEEVTANKEKTQEEEEANIFAGEMLIPHELQSQLVSLRRNKRNIISFAQTVGVSPGIVVGQLQFRGIISHEYLNSYKRRYSWDDIIS